MIKGFNDSGKIGPEDTKTRSIGTVDVDYAALVGWRTRGVSE